MSWLVDMGHGKSVLGLESILGYDVSTMPIAQCIAQIMAWIESGAVRKTFVCANPHSLVEARKDLLFEQAIKGANLVTPDGTGIVLASKILGGSIRARVTGSDIFRELSNELNRSGGRSYFFLGSTEQTLAAITEKMTREFPNINVAGTYSPPYEPEFNREESRQMVEAVNAVKPDVLWVGMTAPKQEKWIFQHADELDVKFIGAIGAVFDFYVGNVKRSHPIFQRMGLEWLPRLIQQPRRLFKRNFVSSPLFLWLVALQKFEGMNTPRG